ncbi:MAG: hypothetical protein AAGJ81_09395 [Verrucomicrobiota bacterium]
MLKQRHSILSKLVTLIFCGLSPYFVGTAQDLIPVLPPEGDSADQLANVIPSPDLWTDTTDAVDFDFARFSSGGRVTYVGSGDGDRASGMIDGDPATSFSFVPGAQGGVFILELSSIYPVYQASIVASEPIEKVEIWFLSEAPEELFGVNPENGLLSIPDDFLNVEEPSATVVVPNDKDETFLTISLPEASVRYLLVRVFGKDANKPLEVSRFSVIGQVPRDLAPFGLLTDDQAFPEPRQSIEFEDPPRLPPGSFEPPFIPPASP